VNSSMPLLFRLSCVRLTPTRMWARPRHTRKICGVIFKDGDGVRGAVSGPRGLVASLWSRPLGGKPAALLQPARGVETNRTASCSACAERRIKTELSPAAAREHMKAFKMWSPGGG